MNKNIYHILNKYSEDEINNILINQDLIKKRRKIKQNNNKYNTNLLSLIPYDIWIYIYTFIDFHDFISLLKTVNFSNFIKIYLL